MNRQSNERLEDILDALVASDIGPNSPQFADWIRRYPDFEQELIGFAASWSLMKSLPPATEPAAVDEETLVLRGMSIVQNLLHEQGEMQQRRVEKGSASSASSAIESETGPFSCGCGAEDWTLEGATSASGAASTHQSAPLVCPSSPAWRRV